MANMKTLTFYQFLVLLEKTHCNCYHIAKVNGAWVAFLGFPVGDNSIFAVYKSRPFTLETKFNVIKSHADLYGITFIPYPSNIFSR